MRPRPLAASFLSLLLLAAAASAAPAAQPQRPQRVVSQSVGTDELLLAVAEPAQIAALSHLSQDAKFSLDPAKASAFPKLKSSDAESVLALRPDLVLAASYTQPETLALLRRAGVPLIVAEKFDTLPEVYENLRAIGKAVGHEERAEAVIAASQQRVAALAKALAGVKPVRVLSASTYPFTAGAETTFQDLCDHAGALNVAAEAGLRGHVPTPEERVSTWTPEVLIASGEEGEDPAALAQRLGQLPAYRALAALKQGRVLMVPGPLMSSVTHNRIAAFEWLARRLHPERFK
jgi:iron complex transport system substrate-binding protein